MTDDRAVPRQPISQEYVMRSKSLGCWLSRHTWVTRVNADARWQECERCGKYSRKVAMANRFPRSGTGDGGGGFGGF